MKILPFIQLFLFLIPLLGKAQYPPPAGQPGSTAVKADSSIIMAWASECELQRGWMDISQPELGLASWGDASDALGPAEGNSVDVVSLGDGGLAVLGFQYPLTNGEGWDFVVFENALNDTFLELAMVEVSSDGEYFVPFPALSLTDTSQQVGTFGESDCSKIHNLAGKYRQGYGTPFDLEELAAVPGLDVFRITHIRIRDVVGCIQDDFATLDSGGHKINDPWPTPFETGGFDLDGVGLIHTEGAGILEYECPAEVFPNPCREHLTVSLKNSARTALVRICAAGGQTLLSADIRNKMSFDISSFPPGVYYVCFETDSLPYLEKVLKVN